MTWWLAGLGNCNRNRQPHPVVEHMQSKKLSKQVLIFIRIIVTTE